MPTSKRVLRIYDSLRTVHLERLAQLEPAVMIYGRSRYDFDSSLIDPDNPPILMRRRQAVTHLLRHSYDVVEINEPMMSWLWLPLLAEITAMRLRGLVVRPRASVVAYCIGYDDPAEALAARRGLPLPLARGIARVMMNLIVRGTDRLAFGTSGSRSLYQRYVSADALRSRACTFEAVPAACPCLTEHSTERAPRRALFVGAFDERKGIRQLMAAWESVARLQPGAFLTLVGTGPLTEQVVTWARGRADVEVEVDPPRARVHAAYRAASTLVLLSQRVGTWREQVGLPIVEGLAHGCEVVTTSETGLAAWLTAHGYEVLDPDLPAQAVARSIVDVLNGARGRERILKDLPARDQRLAADFWMISGVERTSSD